MLQRYALLTLAVLTLSLQLQLPFNTVLVTSSGFQGEGINLGKGPAASIPNGTKDVYGRKGLQIVHWIAQTESTAAGRARLGKEHVFLKCTYDEDDIWQEKRAIMRLMDAANGKFTKRNVYYAGAQNVAKIIETLDTPDGEGFCTISEVAGTVALSDFARKLTWRQKAKYLPGAYMQVIRGLNYLHSIGIAHRDVKSDNIVLHVSRWGLSWQLRVKIIDFDLAYVDTDEEDVQRRYTTGSIGTPFYRPPTNPQTFLGHKLTDSWGMGVVIYETLSGRMPYGSNDLVWLDTSRSLRAHSTANSSAVDLKCRGRPIHLDDKVFLTPSTDHATFNYVRLSLEHKWLSMTRQHFYAPVTSDPRKARMVQQTIIAMRLLLTLNEDTRPLPADFLAQFSTLDEKIAQRGWLQYQVSELWWRINLRINPKRQWSKNTIAPNPKQSLLAAEEKQAEAYGKWMDILAGFKEYASLECTKSQGVRSWDFIFNALCETQHTIFEGRHMQATPIASP